MSEPGAGSVVTRNGEFLHILARLEKIAPTSLNVLIEGETGTGKESVARFVHDHSRNACGPFVAVDCGTIRRRLCESTFFGYEKGAFTGASETGRKGLFELARDGSLFLDEIGEMPLEMQAGLLRVLDSGSYRPLGSDVEHTTNCRIIAATNRDLGALASEGSFRPDLYYRLSVAKFTIPPLRRRPEDVSLLARRILLEACEKIGAPPKRFSHAAILALESHPWPGNVRQLRNVVEGAALAEGEIIGVGELPEELRTGSAPRSASTRPGEGKGRRALEKLLPRGSSVRLRERQLIIKALATYGNVAEAADALGISRSTLYRKFDTLGIDYRSILAEREP